MESAEPRRFSIVVFGATGFTGQFVVEELARTMDTEAKFTWAVAGRDMTKLQAVLSTASKVTGNCYPAFFYSQQLFTVSTQQL